MKRISLAALFCVFFLSEGWANSKQAPNVVEVATVSLGSVERNARLVGRVKSHKASTLKARKSGIVKTIYFPDASEVTSGDRLLLIDDPEVLQKHTLAKKQSSLAYDEFRRQQILYQNRTGTKKKLEQAQTSWLAAQTQESQAKLEMDMYLTRAPFKGLLGNFRVSEGAFVQEGETLVNMYDPQSLYVEFEVPGDASLNLKVGQELKISTPLLQSPVKAQIKTIESRIDSPTQTALVRADLTSLDTFLPGEFVNIGLVINETGQVLKMPKTAVFLDAGTPHTYVLQQNTLKLVSVETGLEGNGMVEVKKGVQANDIVVVGGQLRLKNGEEVKVYTK